MSAGVSSPVGLESAAATVLRQAVENDQNNRKVQAVTCYTEGAGLLIDALRSLSVTSERRPVLRKKAEEYMNRAEVLKEAIEQEKRAGKFHEQIIIKEDSEGNDYDSLFRSLTDDTVKTVEVDDAYVKAHHQDTSELRALQLRAFKELADTLRQRNMQLTVNYSTTLHDREIRFGNGWIVKIGRGLDFYKKPQSNYGIGGCDMMFRKCNETTIDIFHKTQMR